MTENKKDKASTITYFGEDIGQTLTKVEQTVIDECRKLLDLDDHVHLMDCDIAFCWKTGWRADEDNMIKVAEAKKTNELGRELRHSGKDVTIVLNYELINAESFTTHQLRFWLDHCLCAIKPKYDSDGETQHDDRGRPVFRQRKPTVQLFPEVYERHGLALKIHAELREIILERDEKDRPLLAMMEQQQQNEQEEAAEAAAS